MLAETDAAPALADDPVIATGTPLGPELLAGVAPDVGFAVWQVLRTLRLWTAQPEGQRDGLFDPGFMDAWERALLTGSLEPDVRFPLAVIVGELNAHPAGEARLSWACVCVADWALGHGAVRAGLAFAEAAALASPTQARYAWLAGRLLRTHGEGRTAERWLRRAYRLAVAQKDGDTQARALTALGNLLWQRGNLVSARALHLRALRTSRRWRLREHEGMALHDLFVVATDQKNRAEAEQYARAAVAACRSSERLPRLAHDIAYEWMEQGYCARALRVFDALRPHFPRPDHAVKVVANQARAAGGIGDRALFLQRHSEALSLVPMLDTREALAAAFLDMAYGAVALEEWQIALDLAAEAAEAAQIHSDKATQMRAEALAGAVERRDLSGVDAVVSERRATIPAGEQFAAEMVSLLAQGAGAVA
ncbi:MAG TPA: tetratricopeptide repeat protein [Longimicrobium sp.]|jgi:tetratricopeptide (TPR) repeat protein